MRSRTALASIVIALALVLPVVVGSVAAGAPTYRASTGAVLAGPVTSKISYQGRLTDSAGDPLNGAYNLTFQLWDDGSAGSQVGSDITLNSVPVSDGLFKVELPVNAAQFTGEALRSGVLRGHC
jgi:hypothetical protein